MYVCVCNAITDKQIRKAAKSGVRNLRQLQAELGVATNCGSCKDTATQILRDSRRACRPSGPKVYVPSVA